MNPKLTHFLAAWLAVPLALFATDAIQNVQPQNYAGLNPIESGFSFQPTTNFTVTALGYRFKPSTDSSSYVVSLLDSSGTAIATATLNAPAATTNQLVYTNIGPVQLTGGSTNYLLAYDGFYFASNAVKQWDGYVIDSRVGESGSFSVAPEVEYLGATSGTNAFQGTNAPYYLLVGPNFQFTSGMAVQPSSLLISLTSSNTVQLIWPASDVAGQLQAAAALGVVMTNVLETPVVVGSSNVVELPVVPPGAFFRLAY
jgi:hypothetical protein